MEQQNGQRMNNWCWWCYVKRGDYFEMGKMRD